MGTGEFITLSSGLRGMTGKYIVKMYGITESNLVAISEHLYKKIMMCKKKKKKKNRNLQGIRESTFLRNRYCNKQEKFLRIQS